MLCNVTDGTATCVTADFIANCGRWNSHLLEWLMLLPLWQMEYRLIPLRTIVSSTSTVTYNTAKELAKILKPLVGIWTHHVQNTRDFVEHLEDVRLKQGECIISYDVTALFASVPIQPVLNIIKQRLANDKDLQQRTTMSINHIISLLEFCLKSTSFVFLVQHYQQMEGAAMEVHSAP